MKFYLLSFCICFMAAGFTMALRPKTDKPEVVQILKMTDKTKQFATTKNLSVPIYEYQVLRISNPDCGTEVFYLTSFDSLPIGKHVWNEENDVDIVN